MRYTKIHSQMWFDEKFLALSGPQRLLFFYLLSCPHGNSIGLYVLKMGYICDDVEISEKEAKEHLSGLCEVGKEWCTPGQEGLILYDHNLHVVLIKNFIKHNPITNPNQIKGAKKVFSQLPKSWLLKVFADMYPELVEGLTDNLPQGPMSSLPEPGEISPEPEESKPKTREMALEVFNYWKEVMNHPEAIFSDERRRKIEVRLKRFSVEDCKLAIDGCKSSEFHMGKNPEGTVHDDIDLIFRNTEKFESFKRKVKKAKTTTPKPSPIKEPEQPPGEPLKDPSGKFAQLYGMIEKMHPVLPAIDESKRQERKELLKKQAEEIKDDPRN